MKALATLLAHWSWFSFIVGALAGALVTWFGMTFRDPTQGGPVRPARL